MSTKPLLKRQNWSKFRLSTLAGMDFSLLPLVFPAPRPGPGPEKTNTHSGRRSKSKKKSKNKKSGGPAEKALSPRFSFPPSWESPPRPGESFQKRLDFQVHQPIPQAPIRRKSPKPAWDEHRLRVPRCARSLRFLTHYFEHSSFFLKDFHFEAQVFFNAWERSGQHRFPILLHLAESTPLSTFH